MGVRCKKPSKDDIREFYLLPTRSEGENVAKGLVIIVSWIVGIACQQNVGSRALGGAYLIFALSLILDFFSKEKRKCSWAKHIYSAFRVLILIMMIGAFALTFYEPLPGEGGNESDILSKISACLFFIGWGLFAITFISLVAVALGTDTSDDEGSETMGAEEDDDKNSRSRQFQWSLVGPFEGGSTK